MNDPSIIRNTAHVVFVFRNKILENVRLIKINSLPAINQHITPKRYVDDAIDEVTLVGTYRHSDFVDKNLSNLWITLLNFDPIKYNHAARKIYVLNIMNESSLLRRDPNE